MGILDEVNASASASAMNAALRAATEAVSGRQTVTFSKYVRRVLPADGFAYWIRASLLGDVTADVSVSGSLHVAFTKLQDATETFSQTAVTFTSEDNVLQNFAVTDPQDILIATAGTDAIGDTNDNFGNALFPVRFAFSRLGYYENAGIFHYSGVALFPHLVSQIIDDLSQLDDLPVVSNSLPAWLSLNNYAPFYGFGNSITLYPSMLTAANAIPPYGVVDIDPGNTEAIAAVPFLDSRCSHFQLARDRAKVTFYGAKNDAVMTFMDCVLQYSADYDVLGLLNAPVVRDEKLAQPELSILAAKKSVTFDVSYHQSSMRDIARQLIVQAKSAVLPVYPASWPVNPAG